MKYDPKLRQVVDRLVCIDALAEYAAALNANGHRLIGITIETSAPELRGLGVWVPGGVVKVEQRKRPPLPAMFIDEASDTPKDSEEPKK